MQQEYNRILLHLERKHRISNIYFDSETDNGYILKGSLVDIDEGEEYSISIVLTESKIKSLLERINFLENMQL